MTIGFGSSTEDESPDDTEGIAMAALDAGAVNPKRVAAWYVARHLTADDRPRPSIEDTASLAQWLTGGLEEDEDEEPSGPGKPWIVSRLESDVAE